MATLVGNIKGPPGPMDWTAADAKYVDIAGDQMTGPLLITGGGELDLTSTGHHLQLGASTGGNLAFDANEIQSRNNGVANVLNLNPHGGNVWLGTDGVASALHLRGPFPTGTPLDFYAGGQRVGSMFPFGSAFPVDLVIQTVGTNSGNLALQCARGEIRLETQSNPIIFSPLPGEVARFRSNDTGEIMTLGGNPACLQYFRTASPSGSAHGYIGADSTWGMRMTASVRDALLHASAGDTRVQASGVVDIWSGGSYTARFGTAGQFFVQRSAQDDTLAGMHWHSVWCSLRATCNIDQAASLYLDKRGAGAGVGQEFVRFDMTEVKVGSITRTSAGVAYNTTSDYRAKDVRGPITGARERIKLLRPIRAVYHADETGAEVDAFIAHEVSEVVPEAVTGDKDAVATEANAAKQGLKVGEPVLQQLDTSRLVPLLVAAVQELSAKVDELESEIATLKGAA